MVAFVLGATGASRRPSAPPPSTRARAAGLAAEIEIYGYNTSPIEIPDSSGSTPGHARSSVTISGAPHDAVVSRARYRCRIAHAFVGDLLVRLTNDAGNQATLWNRLGGFTDEGQDDDGESDGDIYLERWIDDVFDGAAVNQRWYLDVEDQAAGNVGYIDYFEVWLTYDSPASSETPAVTASPPMLTDTPTRAPTRTPTRTPIPGATATSVGTRTPTGTSESAGRLHLPLILVRQALGDRPGPSIDFCLYMHYTGAGSGAGMTCRGDDVSALPRRMRITSGAGRSGGRFAWLLINPSVRLVSRLKASAA